MKMYIFIRTRVQRQMHKFSDYTFSNYTFFNVKMFQKRKHTTKVMI